MTPQRAMQVLRRCGWAAFGLIVAAFLAWSLAWIFIRDGEDAFYEALGELVRDAFKDGL